MSGNHAIGKFGSAGMPLIGYLDRSPTMRGQRAKLKSRRDDLIIAPGKRSAARGCGHKMIFSFFSSCLARLLRAKQEEKKGTGYPRTKHAGSLNGPVEQHPDRGSIATATPSPKTQSNRAFSLLELLIVVAYLALLAAMFMTVLARSRARSSPPELRQ